MFGRIYTLATLTIKNQITMKRNFLIGIFVCSNFVALAQWTTSGTHIYNSNTGNVGVGLTSPSEKFEVSGNVKAWNSYIGTSNALISRSGDHVTGVGINSWLTSVGVTGAYSGWDLFYAQTGTGDIAMRVTNGSGTHFGQLTGSGSEAPIYFGDANHFIKSTWGVGVTVGTFGASNGIVLRETSGNVGVGTTTPSQKLHVSGGALVSSLAGSGNRMVIANASGVLSTQAIPSGADNLGNHTATVNIRLNGKWLSNDGGDEGIAVDNSGNVTCKYNLSLTSGSISVSNGHLNIPSGRANIGTTSDAFHTLNVFGPTKLNGHVGIGGDSGSGSDKLMVHGDISCTGSGTSSGGWITSDKRYKKEIAGIPNALEKVLKLKGVTYDLRQEEFPDMDFTYGQRVGYIAQELIEVFPQAVRLKSDGYYAVSYESIIPLLSEALKEQSVLLNLYENELSELRLIVDGLTSDTNGVDKLERAEIKGHKSTLSQNRPNPFNDRTVIGFNLQDEFRNASIVITDLNGIQKLFFDNLKTGDGAVTVTHDQLYSGIFLYSLILDGEVVDTKRMVVAL